ncbi:MAG: LamG-like jellyroll fold domain-containing protein [Bacteroidia bacterium]
MKRSLLFLWLLVMTTSFILAQSNQYLHFDRNNDYVRLDGASQYIANTTTISMAGWFYTDQLAYGQGMIGLRGSGNGFYLIQLADGKLECRLQTNTGLHQYVSPNFVILPGVWQHVAWVYDGSTVTLYIDGVVRGSSSASGTISDAGIPFTIGRSILANLNFYFGGRADEVTLWDKALTQADIQDMMANELTGTEANLQLYYKMNQGAPGGDNTSISKLISEVDGGNRDADLIGFAMNGATSNFAGMLQTGFQAISFDEVPNKLVTDAPFALTAAASSSLPVTFTIESGPATVSGNMITLDGTAGEVVIKASQPGDATYAAATDVLKAFTVVDPQVSVPLVELRNPLEGDVNVPFLKEIHLAAIATTDFAELLSVDELEFEINGETVPAKNWGNGFFTAYWLPPAHGSYALTAKAKNNFGAIGSSQFIINVIAAAPSITETAFTGVWINSTIISEEVEAELPAFLGSYDRILATLDVTCPPGGCGPWDRVAKVEIQTHEGNWVEMIRYITPYGVACSHTLDVTDFMSALQGKIRFRMSCETFDNGFEYELRLDYQPGIPTYAYSKIDPVWHQRFDFGNPGDLQPVDDQMVKFFPNSQAAKFKLISSGHGWGENNTNNAAEFYNTTHHVWVDGAQTFAQNNWLICNPNPDACSPQNGTWFHNRAGFCPGAISPWFDFDMTPYIANGTASLGYKFDEAYVDLCHANNPNCVSGQTCPDCNDGFNPHLIVASSIINFGDGPLDTASVTSVEELALTNLGLSLYPNPSSGQVEVMISGLDGRSAQQARIVVFDALGKRLAVYEGLQFVDQRYSMDLSHLPNGRYMVNVALPEGQQTKILEIRR